MMNRLYGDLRRMCRKIRIIPKTQHLDYRQSYCSVACNGRHYKCAYTWRKLSIIARLSIFAHGKMLFRAWYWFTYRLLQRTATWFFGKQMAAGIERWETAKPRPVQTCRAVLISQTQNDHNAGLYCD